MELKKIFRMYKNVIIVGALLVLPVLGLIFGIVPLTQKTLTLWDQVKSLTSEVDQLKSKSAILQALDEDALRRDVLTLASAVPPDKSLASVLTTIDTVSGQTGVALSSVSLARPGSIATESAKKLTKDEAKLGTSLLPIAVDGKAMINEVKSFVSTVIAVRRFFRLRSMDISDKGDLTTVRLALDAFYLPYPKTVGSLAAISPLTDEETQTITKVGALPLASVTVESTVSASVPSGKEDPFSP